MPPRGSYKGPPPVHHWESEQLPSLATFTDIAAFVQEKAIPVSATLEIVEGYDGAEIHFRWPVYSEAPEKNSH